MIVSVSKQPCFVLSLSSHVSYFTLLPCYNILLMCTIYAQCTCNKINKFVLNIKKIKVYKILILWFSKCILYNTKPIIFLCNNLESNVIGIVPESNYCSFGLNSWDCYCYLPTMLLYLLSNLLKSFSSTPILQKMGWNRDLKIYSNFVPYYHLNWCHVIYMW